MAEQFSALQSEEFDIRNGESGEAFCLNSKVISQQVCAKQQIDSKNKPLRAKAEKCTARSAIHILLYLPTTSSAENLHVLAVSSSSFVAPK